MHHTFIHVTDKHFQLNKCDPLQLYLDLAKHLHAWTNFTAGSPYFPELEHNHHLVFWPFLDFPFYPKDILHTDLPFCVQQLPPYISNKWWNHENNLQNQRIFPPAGYLWPSPHQYTIQDTEGSEFYLLIFDFMLHKFNHSTFQVEGLMVTFTNKFSAGPWCWHW